MSAAPGIVAALFAAALTAPTHAQTRIDCHARRWHHMNVEGNFRNCGVAFHLGEQSLIRRRRDDGAAAAAEAAEVCAGDGEFERDAAKAELAR